jgi:N-acetylmuramoyl-L-alanine amidase
MQKVLDTRLSRRKLLTAAAGAAVAASVGDVRSEAARDREVVEVLVHDAVQDAAAFGRGRLQGTRLRGGLLEGSGLFESEVITSPFPFTHIGIHWAGRGVSLAGVHLEARTSLDGSSWTDWRPLSVEARPEETPARETYGALLAAPRHVQAQYRVHFTTQAQLSTVTTTFLNSADGPRSQEAAATPVRNPVIDKTREEWGCDEKLRFRGRKEVWPRMYVPVKKLILHHTASDKPATALDLDSEVDAEVRAIYTYHARTLGWGDIGYNALIGLNGKSYEGRHGRGSSGAREVFSHDVVAGHAFEHNYGTCGVALVGYFHPPRNHTPTDNMLSRLLDVFEQVGLSWEIQPTAKSKFLKSTGSWNNGADGSGLINLCGHRDTFSTACPGDIIYNNYLANLRSQLKTRLEGRPAGDTTEPVLAEPAPVLLGDDGINTSLNRLKYSWSGGNGLEYSYYLEGWNKASNSEAITYLTGFDSTTRKPVWSGWNTTPTSSEFEVSDGHYTIHVRSRDSNGNLSYQGNKTVLNNASPQQA